MRNLIYTLIMIYCTPSFAATGFGERHGENKKPTEKEVEAVTEAAPPKATAKIPPTAKGAAPGKSSKIDWVSIPFEKAENELLTLLRMDLEQIERYADRVAIYDVDASGRVSDSYRESLKNKIERVILSSKQLHLVQCSDCETAKLTRTEDGKIHYRSRTQDPQALKEAATRIGTPHFLLAELKDSPEDLKLRMRLMDGARNEILWSREYSAAASLDQDKSSSFERGKLEDGDSLKDVLLGEIAFTMIFSPGVTLLPSVDNGSGSQLGSYPSLELFIGEKFDGGHKTFGFQLGAAANAGLVPDSGQALPFAMKVGPKFRYTFNPYSVSTARYSISTEVGGFISSGLVTPYIGVGPEIKMIRRFSLTLMPLYFFPASVGSAETIAEQADGTFSNLGSDQAGVFGGFGLGLSVNMNW